MENSPVAALNSAELHMADSMQTVMGGCYCGNVVVKIRLTRDPASYNARACDCGFCRKHAAAYISDALGSMEVEIGTAGDRGSYRQGSEAADFLLCRRCGVLAGVTCEIDGRLYGAVNVRSLESSAAFGPELPVSPKQLSAADKLQRWREVWFPDVSVRTRP
jgi:hypothetical protein